MPGFRIWPAKYPITVETTSPQVFVGSQDIERLDVVGNSWGDRRWTGDAIAEFRRRLEARALAARAGGEMSLDESSTPLVVVIERVLQVVREAERAKEAYELHYVGD